MPIPIEYVHAGEDAWDNHGISFNRTTNTFKLYSALISDTYEREQTLEAVRDGTHVRTAEDEVLEKIGRLVGVQRRTNENDDTLRARIIAEGASGLSDGTFESVLEIVATILNINTTEIRLVPLHSVGDRVGGGVTYIRVPENALDASNIDNTTLTEIFDGLVFAGHRVVVQKASEGVEEVFTLRGDGQIDDPSLGLTTPSNEGGYLLEEV